jgi:hypothetical protein
VAERVKRCREASTEREAGVVVRLIIKKENHPGCSYRLLRDIFLMSQPLLAVMQGGDYASRLEFIHTFYDRRWSLVQSPA